MQVTQEMIGGKLYTVIWHQTPRPLENERLTRTTFGFEAHHINAAPIIHLATILPPLPRNPKAEDAALVARYMSEGLFVYGNLSAYGNDALLLDRCGLFAKNRYGQELQITDREQPFLFEITHCLDTQGNRVEVPIV